MSFFTENGAGIPNSVLKEKHHLVEQKKNYRNVHTQELRKIKIISLIS